MKHLVIVNPNCYRGAGAGKAAVIAQELTRLGESYEVVISRHVGHPRQLALDNPDFSRVWAVGGDGTISEVASALSGTSRELAMIPLGTGNDFIKSAGIPRKFEDALRVAISGKARLIDTGRCGEQFFINGCGMGFDADVAAGVVAQVQKGHKGRNAYLASIFDTISTFTPHKLTLWVEDKPPIALDALLVAVGNGKCIGGGIKICPKAVIDDGLLDVCAIVSVKKWQLPLMLPFAVAGLHTDLLKPFCVYLRVKKVRVGAEKELNIQRDGNVSRSRELDVEIRSKSLTIIVE